MDKLRSVLLGTLILFLLSFASSRGGAQEAFALTLVENGKYEAVIIIDAKADGCVPYAAFELRDYIQKISGAELPVIKMRKEDEAEIKDIGANLILVGESVLTQRLGLSAKELKPDGFQVLVKDNLLVIIGRDDARFSINYDSTPGNAGTLYGVYRLLEELGVRWFYPNELGTIIPEMRDIHVEKLDIVSEPYFPYRFVGYGVGNFAWYRRIGGGGDRDPWATRHTFNQTINFREKYREKHPEYFRVEANGAIGNNIALGHPGVTDVIIEEARNYFQSNRPEGKKYFLVIPPDGLSICQCSLCQSKVDRTRGREGIISDKVGKAVVEVASALKEEFPDYYIVYCAYNHYKLPPQNIEKFPSNVVVLIAEMRYAFHSDVRRQEAYDLLREWQELEPAAIYFCRYYNHTLKMTPSPFFNIIDRDIKTMKTISEKSPVKIKGEMNFTTVQDRYTWSHSLNQYVTAKLLWDPDLKIEYLLNDYYEKFYGPAAGYMRKFWEKCEQLYLSDRYRAVYSIDDIHELEGYLTQAKEAVADTPYAPRVDFIDEGFESVRHIKLKLEGAETDLEEGPEDALIAHYKFNEGTGNTVRDSAGNHHGTIRNARWIKTKKGYALEFSGEDSGVRISPIRLADTDYTIEAWLNPSKLAFSGMQFITGPSAWNRQSFKISDGRLGLLHAHEGGGWRGTRLFSPPWDFLPGEWFHVAGTFSETLGMSVYINGALVAMDINENKPSRWSIYAIGARGLEEFSECFAGAMAELKIYRRELNVEEIKKSYHQASSVFHSDAE